MANVLFIVITPFQLMCAVEARNVFCGADKCHLIVIDRERVGHPSSEHLTRTIDRHWDSVIRLQETKRRGLPRTLSRLWLTFKLLIHLPSNGALRNRAVFVGEPRVSWLRALGKFFGHATVWLDDGAASLFAIADMRNSRSYRLPVDGLPHMFTIFGSAEIEAENAGGIAHNRMNEHDNASAMHARISRGEAIIAGQWLSEAKLISQEDELKYLQAVKSALKDWDVTYAPHRHESQEKLDLIAAMGLPVVRLDNPMEVDFGEREAVPELLISWYSTVLFSARTLFPQMKVCGLRPPLSDETSDGLRQVEIVYDAMKKAGMSLVDPQHFDQFLRDFPARK